MRMRRKRFLEQRLEACGDKVSILTSEDLNFLTAVEKKEYLDLERIFGNSNPVELEIGCGKGAFACEKARRDPSINLLAVEQASNVAVEACERALREGIENLHFIVCRAEYLPKYLRAGSISRIYLNFSCPYPKKSYADHRLTSPVLLKIYDELLSQGADIHQKTDNRPFFEYSLESFSQSGYTLRNISLDLHSSDFEGNIETEYERRFSAQGFPIYRLEAYRK